MKYSGHRVICSYCCLFDPKLFHFSVFFFPPFWQFSLSALSTSPQLQVFFVTFFSSSNVTSHFFCLSSDHTGLFSRHQSWSFTPALKSQTLIGSKRTQQLSLQHFQERERLKSAQSGLPNWLSTHTYTLKDSEKYPQWVQH